MEDQGYCVRGSKLYQDNMSAMLLEKNGKALNGNRTRHINIRYFFLKEKVDAGDSIIEHCTTEKIWGELSTKTFQVSKFRRFRLVILGN